MLPCLKAECSHLNSDGSRFCQKCGAPFLLRNRYHPVKLLGQGGFGRTYLVRDSGRGHALCVIKQFYPEVGVQGESRQIALRMFEQEAERLIRLDQHPQIPTLFEFFSQPQVDHDSGHGDQPGQYLVQQFIDGVTLAQELVDQGQPFREMQVRSLLLDLLPVLEFIHGHRIIHRDIKPDNIIRRYSDGKYVLVDFGASKQLTQTNLIKPGTRLSSVGFGAPEQETGKAEYSSDIYGLGVTCLYLLTGCSPLDLFDYANFCWIWRQVLQRIRNPISDRLTYVLERMVQKPVADRYRSAQAVLQDLTSVGDHSHGQMLKFWSPRPQTTRPDFPPSPPPAATEPDLRHVPPTANAVTVHSPSGEEHVGTARNIISPGGGEPLPNAIVIDVEPQHPSHPPLALTDSFNLGNLRLDSPLISSPVPVQPSLGIYTVTAPPLSSTVIEFEVATVNHNGRKIQRAWSQARCVREVLTTPVAMAVLEMVDIPGGTFLMGSPETENGYATERPQHVVRLADFRISRYPITQVQWRAIAALPKVNLDLSPHPSQFQGDQRPVEQVSWYEAVEFCDRLSHYTKRAYRLPTEAEWEYACRAGSTTPFHCGFCLTPDLANYDSRFTYNASVRGEVVSRTVGVTGIQSNQTSTVGRFPANAFGLCDMHGNVWEWCADLWRPNYTEEPNPDGEAASPLGTAPEAAARSRQWRVLRGGSWGSHPKGCRSAYRLRTSPEDQDASIGFRVVCG